ncbi:MAG: hypothetical protein OXC37_00185 [Bdellovibrionaceae bacterium]|nr:hypothetical protein [Pseudobdellovibrionaceae bacterium]
MCYLLVLTDCSSLIPNQDFVIAETALLRAKKFDAHKLYPNTYLKAYNLYRKAIAEYKKENYESAQNHFQESIKGFEKAELKARLKQAKEEI